MHLYDKKPLFRWKGIVITAAAFLAVIMLFGVMMDRTGGTAEREQLDLLHNAIRNAAVTHYALEGQYPATLEQIVDEYGVIIDADRFNVRYNAFASNVIPNISVELKGVSANDSTSP